MNSSLHHRGPDADGLHLEQAWRSRTGGLSIIDLSTGQQPLYNEDGSVVVVFNGEIYNFQELVKELVACGHSFRTRCDTEVIVHGWEQWGASCVTRFRGMFAFRALGPQPGDAVPRPRPPGREASVLRPAARWRWIFGSELKALLVHPGLPRVIDPVAVEDYFAYGYVPERVPSSRACASFPRTHLESEAR